MLNDAWIYLITFESYLTEDQIEINQYAKQAIFGMDEPEELKCKSFQITPKNQL